jgi:hypothetical protein
MLSFGCAATSASARAHTGLARLAVKYDAEVLLNDLLARLSADCPCATSQGIVKGDEAQIG